MSASGFTPIQLFRTTTALTAPSAANLLAGELAINLTDEKLYFKNTAGAVKLLAESSGASGSVTSVAASGGTTGLTFTGSPITTAGTLTLGGTLAPTNGGTGASTAFTSGSIVFARGASGTYTEDNAALFWDFTNKRLGIGTASPSVSLDVAGIIRSVQNFPQARLTTSNGFGWRIGSTSSGSTLGNFYIQGTTDNFVASFIDSVTISATGNVGIGTSSPTYKLHTQCATAGFDGFLLRNTSANAAAVTQMLIGNDANTAASAVEVNSSTNTGNIGGANALVVRNGLVAPIVFGTAGSERVRIDSSGNVLVGTTTSSSPNPGVAIVPSGAVAIGNSAQASGWGFINFSRSGSAIGSITQNGTTGVLYNTTSDVRLKHDIVDAPDAGSLIDAIKVRSFKWNADDSQQRYGFVAQELLKVAPEAVSVPPDVGQMMGVDYSKLVPMLLKEVQALRTRVAQLEQG